MLPRTLRLAAALALAVAVPAAADSWHQEQGMIVHPQAGDHVGAGDALHVTGLAQWAALPGDARLEWSEDSGLTWDTVTGMDLHGQSITGTYEPTASQGAVVRLRTVANSAPWFGYTMEVFVDA